MLKFNTESKMERKQDEKKNKKINELNKKTKNVSPRNPQQVK